MEQPKRLESWGLRQQPQGKADVPFYWPEKPGTLSARPQLESFAARALDLAEGSPHV